MIPWRDWLKTLTGLVIIIGFLEMLLPANETKKFVKLVLGLVLMMAVLQPILTIVNMQWDTAVLMDSALQTPTDWAGDVERLQSAGAEPLLATVDKMLSSQIEAILLTIGEIDQVEVQVITTRDQVESVIVEIQTSEEISERVSQIITQYLDLESSQVEVHKVY